ncbi:Cdc6/Cdc18 family protein [Halosegnis longus]|uniref:Cdc6/Cdc18 family protein n=1 Tax=Halosegnis longus TaxID=2216012 RepID=UPI00129E21F9|nr:AAA family ATPase [Halosegnis longus]
MLQNVNAFRLDEPPRSVVGRNPEQQALSRCLKPIADGDPGQSAVLEGPAGAGKTTVAHSTLTRLREQSIAANTAHVHCSGMSRYTLLETLGRETGVGPSGHARSAADMLDRLRELTEPWVIVLDEVDGLKDRSAITDIWSLREVTLVAITNNEPRLQAALDEHGKSRIRAMTTISFDSYSDAELIDIMRERIEWGLSTAGTVPDDQLELIARAADGDARNAISILSQSIRAAEEDGRTTVTRADVVEDGIDRAAEEIRDKQLSKHSHHHRAVFDALDDGGECGLETLYERYTQAVSDPRSQRQMSNYISDLVEYDLIERRGPRQDRTFVTRPPITISLENHQTP